MVDDTKIEKRKRQNEHGSDIKIIVHQKCRFVLRGSSHRSRCDGLGEGASQWCQKKLPSLTCRLP